MEERNIDAEVVLDAVAKVVKELDADEDYINYVLFSFTGAALLDFIGPKNLQEVYGEILKKGEERMK